ncbi:M20 family metallopeptidase [Tuwongella immobilis]|uniref:Peptidase M20 dimerisation domain-containing protein n=1 Tax=Tuwongella immobilis TaxID=692036 RepID=A0A6C2YH27_9BACT|nr:M20 family metallopeptidase [Tuwongella immobilis]VIP00569.1 acetylornithine deacetylase : Acetylornithine deacetylase or succinyl-diaminopimelate desuccinylase OS=Singulisphaera acidiphila (strain ATCC BAA-1392 / DSM 18658 / VKM B-2454 / MOB10) GN=Sinac_6205 PE=4 SV=1: Peptidase_M20: M20_dimer [Tuwongella immobilis]VTR96556.1 acetylornithine deacetylase : Acetylornithine deacetylase or succinyl-diaminopimelate desuccinylase OS=Singulisphaera acidiphila (strain ATCC BAA-1392 / DSM 18658 / VKM 
MMPPLNQLLADLVSIPSVNPMGRPADGPLFFENRVTDYLEQFFRNLGVPYERQPVAPLRDNIVARFDSPGATRTLLWEVHQDTVPVDAMVIDPFAAEIRDGRLYGRGACDVKGSMAAMLTAFARLVREKPAGACNVILACTVDEEHTFLGVQELMRRGVQAEAAIVAEPTGLNIVDAHKGVTRWKLTTPGRACHSSRPDLGVNAIYRMGLVLEATARYAQQLSASRSEPRLGVPTISVGRIEGGVSVNTVPDVCTIEVDRRLLPGESGAAAHEDHLAFLRSQPGIDFELLSKPWMACPALSNELSAKITAQLGQAIDAVVGSHSVFAVPFGTDASTIAEYGIPAVVFGPGSIDQAHTNDEWIELSQVEKAVEILLEVVQGRSSVA